MISWGFQEIENKQISDIKHKDVNIETRSRLSIDAMATMGIIHGLCNSYGKQIITHRHRYSQLFQTIAKQ